MGYAFRNVAEAPLDAIHRCVLDHRFQHAARDAWRQVVQESGCAHSDDYEAGFLEGYADFLNADGTGEPPALPPWSYRASARSATVEGQKAVLDWFAGFRHGAFAARASGLRNLVVTPVALPPMHAAPPPAAPPALPEVPGELPPPRPLVPAQATRPVSGPAVHQLRAGESPDRKR